MNYYPYLNDKKFLDQFFHNKITTTFAKITALDWNENPIQQIQGKVITASFTFDGNSSLRRTGNLSILINQFDGLININSLYSINKKTKVEIGIKNISHYYTEYPILWFPLGIYVINTVNLAHDINGLTLNLQIKDKMCLLNGQCGGKIPAATVFDNMDTVGANGQIENIRPTIYQIIQELVNHFGGEQISKIIISDLDLRVKQVMEWTGSSPLYMVQDSNGQFYITVNPDEYVRYISNGWRDVQGSPFEYGHDVGFTYTDFSYPGQLICNPGAAVTQVLDQIISVLGNYEYFYDVYGYFHFQEIKNYLNNSQTQDFLNKINSTGNLDPSDYLLDISNGKTVYRFENSELITSYNNSPQYLNIKNDFVIWGQRKNSGDKTTFPIRYHLAIDKKPSIGNTYQAFSYIDEQDGLTKWACPIKYDSRSGFPETGTVGYFYYDNSTSKIYTWNKTSGGLYNYIETSYSLQNITTKDWRTELYLQGVVSQPYGLESNYYYTELKNEWPKIYNIVPDSGGTNSSGFKPQVLNDFTGIDYFLDFIDTDSNLNDLSVNSIGRRTYTTNDSNVNCVFEPNIPDVVLLKQSEAGSADTSMGQLRQECLDKNQNFYQVSDSIYDLLTGGGLFNSAYENIRQTLHQYISYNENVQIACIPLFFLEPNTRIFIRDDISGIYGDYMINSISFSLDTNSTMNINATRVVEKI